MMNVYKELKNNKALENIHGQLYNDIKAHLEFMHLGCTFKHVYGMNNKSESEKLMYIVRKLADIEEVINYSKKSFEERK